jgi:hypothetical protein
MYEMSLDEFERYFNSWFYGRREQFGMNGWEDFVGSGIEVYTVNGGEFISDSVSYSDSSPLRDEC